MVERWSLSEAHAEKGVTRLKQAIRRVLDELMPLAPDHLPHEINAIKVLKRPYPGVRQLDRDVPFFYTRSRREHHRGFRI
jgi:hypothetical protein